ncbi:serine/threonine-protein kinase [Nonomuraea helvata]|uniref:non-specific serine/threonine protein kinase n=1 Tax=Nonomuraea helvata TaxID=37484 RepID=A0ABV5RVF3_9ACTN
MDRRVIDGRFELMERLGGGGMGLVWRAWDVALHREVALKEVRPPDLSMDEQDPAGARELRARVLREARALARLNHPHVATIHHIVDPGEHGYPWIVMELVSGGSLQDRIQRGPMPPHEVARLGREVLSALQAAHAVGIQHRDVKPANVLLHEDGRSVLTDFGIAAVRESTSLTATGAFIGSPEYMAPERINGIEGDPASDFWSLGMMLYVAVEGRHPLRRSTTLATLAAVLNQDVPPPERAGSLAPVLSALLRRDPAGRPDVETLDRMLASAADPGSAPSSFGSDPSPVWAPSSGSGPSPVWAPSSGSGPFPAEAASPISGSPSVPGPHSMPAAMGPAPLGAAHTAPPVSGHAEPPMGRHAGPHVAGNTVPPVSGATVPPGYRHAPQPSPWNAAPIKGPRTGQPRRAPVARTAAIVVSAAVAVTVTGVLVWQLLPTQPREVAEDIPSAKNTPAMTTDRESPKATTRATPGNLHTPAGMRAMIAKIKPTIGGTKVVKLTAYPTYASIEAPLKRDKAIYDRYDYRDGAVVRSGIGGKVDTPVVDLDQYNWDALPALLRKADKDLGVPKPTLRYVIADPDYAFASPHQVLLVYVSDGYRTGYLVANLQGKVVRTYPSD